jgi:hypothetical protein
MAIAPRWLDDLFQAHAADPAILTAAVMAHRSFAAAVRRAVEDGLREYRATEQLLRDTPGLTAPTPPQAARVEFCRTLGGQIGTVET